jgi:sialidase-1
MKSVFLLCIFFLAACTILYSQTSADFYHHYHRESLEKVFAKFEIEKTGRIAFLGGSITYNSGWRDSVCQFLSVKFPGTKFDFVNAGVPSMGSIPGAFRFEKDVLKNGKVDLLFVEAAVNDEVNKSGTVNILRAMEGIVRHAKIQKPDCGVVFMYFVDPGKIESYRKGQVPEVIELHEKVANHYKISAINLAREVTERIDAGEFSWENDFKDLHPSPFGQNIYYQSIRKFLEYELALKDKNANETILPEPLDKSNYSIGVLIAPVPPKKIKGWNWIENWKPEDGKATRNDYADVPMLVGGYPGEIIKFQFRGNAVGIAVAAGPDAGIIEYSIDESDWKKQDLFTEWSAGLHLPWFYTLGSGLKDRKHTLQIRMTSEKNAKSVGKKCVIRYFYVNESE